MRCAIAVKIGLLRFFGRRNANLAAILYSFFCKGERDIFTLFTRYELQEEISNLPRIREEIKCLSEKPEGVFLEVGFTLDIFDLNPSWRLNALSQVANHYGCDWEEALNNYEVVVVPFKVEYGGNTWYHGTIWARRRSLNNQS